MKYVLVATALAAVAPGAMAGSISVPMSGGGAVLREGLIPTSYTTHIAAPTSNPTRWGLSFSSVTGVFRSWMEFDLSSIPAGATIESVSFRFLQNSSIFDTAVVIRGDYTPGETTYDSLFGFTGSTSMSGTTFFNSMVSDGVVFGGATLVAAGNNTYRSIPLAEAGSPGLAYFTSQIGNTIMLVGGALNEGSSSSHLGTTTMPTLEIVYTDAAIIPLPHAGGMAMAGLGLLAMRRRREM